LGDAFEAWPASRRYALLEELPHAESLRIVLWRASYTPVLIPGIALPVPSKAFFCG
jgi:hypothetical protein